MIGLGHLCISHQAVIFRITLKLIGLFARFQLLIIYVDLPMHMYQGVIQQVEAAMLMSRYRISSVYKSVAQTYQPSASEAFQRMWCKGVSTGR